MLTNAGYSSGSRVLTGSVMKARRYECWTVPGRSFTKTRNGSPRALWDRANLKLAMERARRHAPPYEKTELRLYNYKCVKFFPFQKNSSDDVHKKKQKKHGCCSWKINSMNQIGNNTKGIYSVMLPFKAVHEVAHTVFSLPNYKGLSLHLTFALRVSSFRQFVYKKYMQSATHGVYSLAAMKVRGPDNCCIHDLQM